MAERPGARPIVAPALLPPRPVATERQRWLFRFVRNRLAVAAALTLALLVATALAAPLLSPGDPTHIDLGAQELGPGTAHPFGTDRLGRDVFARVVWGARVSMGVALVAVALGSVAGAALGAAAGYAGGITDAVISRATDAMLALPTFFLLVTVQSLFPPSAANVVAIIAATSWMAIARIVRGQVLSLRSREFVVAARSLGSTSTRIVLRHILPNVSSQIMVYFTLGMADAVLVESALSFLGLGIPAYQPSWGNMLADGQVAILSGAWWVALFPGLMILTAALSINIVGDGLQESLFS